MARTAGNELELFLPEGSVSLALDLLNVFLTDVPKEEKAKFPETLELEGEAVILAGKIPPERSVGYGSAWGNVVGHALEIVPTGGEYGATASSVELPRRGSCPVVGGNLTIDAAGPVWEARAPLEGRCTLHIRIEAEVIPVEGVFRVPGVTWG